MKILSYNIRGGLGIDNIRSTERIAQVVQALEPEVVCFQEVHERTPWSGFIDQPKELRRLLDRHVTLMRCIDLKVGGYGVAIATKEKPTAVHRHRLPSGGEVGKEPRGLLEVRLADYTVFCTHWGLTENERLAQAEFVAEKVNAVSGARVLCGDLNDFAESVCVQALLSRTGFTDADAAECRFTYATDNPTARIDFVLYSAEWACESVAVVDTPASDHFPLLVTLRRTAVP
jgi:endonuclease/exonuclease/phosphatase family metal-dependent hydrolase